MSDRIDTSDPAAMVEVMELTAAELERRGERMLKLSRDLIAQAMHHQMMAALPEERSVGRLGVVTEAEAIRVATELRVFTRTQFADALGLSPPGASRWLTKLLNREHPVIMRRDDGGYHYLAPANGSRPRERVPPPEQQLIDRSQTPERGQAVRVPAVKRHKQELSKPGTGSRLRRVDEEFERNQAKRAERQARKNGRH